MKKLIFWGIRENTRVFHLFGYNKEYSIGKSLQFTSIQETDTEVASVYSRDAWILVLGVLVLIYLYLPLLSSDSMYVFRTASQRNVFFQSPQQQGYQKNLALTCTATSNQGTYQEASKPTFLTYQEAR